MAKPDKPLLSLGAKGTIGDALTFQKRHQTPFVREKPIPAYRRTLPQLYQRWLYEDYAYLWTQQTAATKRQYATNGSRYHLTGFQYWMKYQLTNLPDLAGRWHLDEKSGAIAHDSSRNLNHGTIFGATPTTGVINGAFYFDGLNDKVVIPDHLSLRPTEFTIEFFCEITSFTKHQALATKHHFLNRQGWNCWFNFTNQKVYLDIGDGIIWPAFRVISTNPFNVGKYHIAATLTPTAITLFRDGLLDVSNPGGLMPPSTNDLWLGRHVDTDNYTFHGLIDHFSLYNRALDATEIKRHSERRYPL